MTELVIILPSEDSMSSCLFDKIHLLIISQTASLMGHLAQVFSLSGPTYGRPPYSFSLSLVAMVPMVPNLINLISNICISQK
jgi:hypothetical protein